MIQIFDKLAKDYIEKEYQRTLAESKEFWSNRPNGWGKREEVEGYQKDDNKSRGCENEFQTEYSFSNETSALDLDNPQNDD